VSTLSPFGWKVRQYVYEFFVENERPPQAAEGATPFQVPAEQIQTAYRRLHENHALTLDPGTFQIRMANPLSAVPTRFRVYANERSYWANCAWDAFGVPAMLGCDARIEATCADCDERVEITVADDRVVGDDEIVHFLLPFRLWYEDLIHT
jgi:hypothetical protein